MPRIPTAGSNVPMCVCVCVCICLVHQVAHPSFGEQCLFTYSLIVLLLLCYFLPLLSWFLGHLPWSILHIQHILFFPWLFCIRLRHAFVFHLPLDIGGMFCLRTCLHSWLLLVASLFLPLLYCYIVFLSFFLGTHICIGIFPNVEWYNDRTWLFQQQTLKYLNLNLNLNCPKTFWDLFTSSTASAILFFFWSMTLELSIKLVLSCLVSHLLNKFKVSNFNWHDWRTVAWVWTDLNR